jgi:L-ascorbate metabolism protein UlaG (beta-lactamase superfamily)
MDDMRLCHLGDLGHPLTAEQAEDIDGVDVLFVPVGGLSTIDAAAAVETVRILQPRIVIPMHFQTELLRIQLAPVDRFLKEMGIKAGLLPQPKFSITRAGLSEETQVVVLDYQD